MSANARTDGLLRALRRLDESDRGNIVEHLPPEEVRNACLRLLHEQDQTAPGTSRKPDCNNFADPGSRRVVLQDQKLGFSSLTIQHILPTYEHITVPKKRGTSAPIANDSKRAKIDAAGQRETENDAAPVIVKQEPETIDITSDSEETDTEPVDLFDTKPIPRQPIDHPIYLHIRTESGDATVKDMDELPILVQTELKRRFNAMWSLNKSRTAKYAGCTFNPGKYLMKPRCIRNTVVCGGYNEHRMFNKGGEYRKSADNRCLTAHDPCAYFAKHKDQHIILFVPLPEGHREGKDWKELGYWVL